MRFDSNIIDYWLMSGEQKVEVKVKASDMAAEDIERVK